jgi:hypothetical protein
MSQPLTIALESDLFLLNECDLIHEKKFKKRGRGDENILHLRIFVKDVQKY